MITIYGIKNCDTVKKAKRWLDEHNTVYQFHDFRSDGLDEKLLRQWLLHINWEVLLNKRGTTWRKLADQDKNNINEAKAIEIMLQHPAIIKRPVLVSDETIQVGFNADDYQQLLIS
ncbi:MAG: ArsC family reductase [Gammaproteobacteria bacterium]|nr:ArsC family reductase [Gammaproteobacteria bacterium]